ncbi:hypothetical protein G6F57_005513 [Rhizopus arrhizus]|nr:hypothetical protein G6F30_000270 [Rhizopus arrhizus]KAG0978723.1 hypothetical protein G6F29_009113 [Rhizopus arrhizus]KAG0991398.1 hypothetical protein G6F28_008629 [Rhizopus arrhizus]KAG1012825.1 hypothetical protein G6F27_002457 [Rhizopus arrhizus]KAG1023288.1 hypothetical protein G6F26_006936 [Rhizopus arrhizus]
MMETPKNKTTPMIGSSHLLPTSHICQPHCPSLPGTYPFLRSNTKKVTLTQGHLVLDCPVPTQLMEKSARKEKEFSMMRYTAVTCDPDRFAENQYTLRPQLMNRTTELFIVMTMYNEDEVLFCRTMHGVMKNIAHLCSRTRSRVWDTDGWKKVVVCIVADGRKKCDPRVMDVLTAMGVYQTGIAKNMVNEQPVQAHLFEYTTQLSVDSELRIRGAEKGIVPVQILFCLKEQNAKKINSHRWFFNAFGPILQPNICVLLDVGTRPGNTSIYHLWKAFDANKHVGGACGEICVMKGTACVDLLNPLVAAQNFEYKMSNILDKPLESVFGYISVLPGAFSAYRYAAIQNDIQGMGPLQKYFLGEQQADTENIFSANMYLAEDRILCFELLAKKHQQWVLKYVQNAFGETDCPSQLPEFISQRRRWLNGSFFAAVYSQYHFARIWSTNHSVGRKLMLSTEFFYSFVNLIFSWLGMANFYLTFYFVTKSLALPEMDPLGDGWGERVFSGLWYLYIFLFISSFICSLGNRPQGSKWMFTLSVIAYGIIMMYMTFAGGWLAYRTLQKGMQSPEWDPNDTLKNFNLLMNQSEFRDVVISLLATWGTKGDNTATMDLGVASKAGTNEKGVEAVEVELYDGIDTIDKNYERALDNLSSKPQLIHNSRAPKTKQDDYYRGFRTRLVLTWIGCNAVLVACLFLGFIMEAEQIREGVKNIQQGDKAASKGLFRKPDWDLAASYYDRAATCFKIAKSYDQAVQAYAKSSEALFKSDAIHLAGKATENAAFILAQNLNQPQRAAEAYQKASNFFMTQGSIDRAAEQLEKAGRALENVDVNASFDMYSKACTLYEQEDRGRFAMEIYKKAISLLVRNKKYDKAIEMLKRETQVLQKLSSRTHLYKANLSILVLVLAIGDDVEAGKQFSSMCGQDAGFAHSEEAEIAEDLLRAYDQRDQELLERTVRVQHMTFLDNEIVKLARLLTVPGEVLSQKHSNYHRTEAETELYGNKISNNENSNTVEEEDEDEGLR